MLVTDVAKEIKNLVDKHGMIDVGSGAEKQLGVSRMKFNEALSILKKEKYVFFKVELEELGKPNVKHLTRVIVPPKTTIGHAAGIIGVKASDIYLDA